MNKKVIFVFVLTVVAIVILALFSFGPLSNKGRLTAVNPDSLKSITSETVNINKNKLTFNDYHNKDLTENFYTVKFPQDWNVKAGSSAGSYSLNFSESTGSVELMDVPDNSTLELFVLSQEEPNLKKSIPGYQKVSYQKTAVNGQEADQLIYTDGNSQTVKTYIAGADKAGVLTFTSKQNSYDKVQPVFTSILNSFNWETK